MRYNQQPHHTDYCTDYHTDRQHNPILPTHFDDTTTLIVNTIRYYQPTSMTVNKLRYHEHNSISFKRHNPISFKHHNLAAFVSVSLLELGSNQTPIFCSFFLSFSFSFLLCLCLLSSLPPPPLLLARSSLYRMRRAHMTRSAT
jgi:hypothetical protein